MHNVIYACIYIHIYCLLPIAEGVLVMALIGAMCFDEHVERTVSDWILDLHCWIAPVYLIPRHSSGRQERAQPSPNMLPTRPPLTELYIGYCLLPIGYCLLRGDGVVRTVCQYVQNVQNVQSVQ